MAESRPKFRGTLAIFAEKWFEIKREGKNQPIRGEKQAEIATHLAPERRIFSGQVQENRKMNPHP
jgi:hypothetical protein